MPTTQLDAICLIGPTASGKTSLALQLAQQIPLEIISVDSALVYKNMNIGTAKPTLQELAQVPHHLINIIEPTDAYSAANFYTDARQLIAQIKQRKHLPLLVGGTMLYIKSLENGLSNLPKADVNIREDLNEQAKKYGWAVLHKKLADIDPLSAQRLDPNDAQRIQRALEVFLISKKTMSELLAKKPEIPEINLYKIALIPADRGLLHKQIEQRFLQILQAGLVDEVNNLRKIYPALTLDMPSMRCVGYRQAWQYIDGAIDKKEFIEQGFAATRQLAKRQLTWLRSMTDLKTFDCQTKNLINPVLDSIQAKITSN